MDKLDLFWVLSEKKQFIKIMKKCTVQEHFETISY